MQRKKQDRRPEEVYRTAGASGGVFLNVLLVFSLIFAGVFFSFYRGACTFPLRYDIGRVDEGFGVSRDAFLQTVISAEKVWEDEVGINLFEYDPGAKFTINLIFDERQALTAKERLLKKDIEEKKREYRRLVNEYKKTKKEQLNNINLYETMVAQYKQKVEAYNKRVGHYNSIGGAPEAVFKELNNEKSALNKRRETLTRQEATLKKTSEYIAKAADTINDLANSINREVAAYNNEFTTSKIFDQGEYTGDRINIYQFDATDDLVVVMAHEFGHAINIDHVPNPASIMYYLIGGQDMQEPTLSDEDIAALRKVCRL